MLRKFVVILTMLFCSMATQLYALGLGTVTVESALNQPLRMRVELLQLGDTRLQRRSCFHGVHRRLRAL